MFSSTCVSFAPASLIPHRAHAGAAILLALYGATAAADEVITLPEATPAPVSADAAVELTPLTVSGEKLGRALEETTSSVVVVTQDDMDAAPVASVKDVVTRFANVVGAAGDREIAIRGVPQGGIGGEGDTISVYLDGVALPSRAASFAGPLSAWDLERLELLRGAQSSNQGRNSLAGSVVLETVQPTQDWDLRLRAGVMSRDGHDYALAAGGPLGDSLAFRVALQDRYDNGDVTNVTRNEDDAQRYDNRNGRVSLAWAPATDSDYQLRYSYIRADTEFGEALHDASGGERTATSNVRGGEDDRTQLHSLRQQIELGSAWRLEAISGYTRFENVNVIDFDRTESEGGYSDNFEDDRILSQELRAQYTGQTIRAVIGAYYADGDTDTLTLGRDVSSAGGLVLINGFVDGESSTRTGALFAEADWDFASAWRATAGVRINRELNSYRGVSDLDLTLTGSVPGLPLDLPIGVPLPDALSDGLAVLLPSFVPPDYDDGDRNAFTDVLPKLGLTWFVSDATTLGLSYQEGYRSGGVSMSFFGGAVSPYKPEYTRTGELAVRSRWFDQRLMLNANLFYTDWRDQQVTIGETSGFETVTTNAGRSHYYGIETELVWAFSGPFELFASIGLLRSEFDEFVNEGEDYANNQFPYAPEESASLGLNLLSWKKLSGQLSAHYIGEFYSDPDNDERTLSDERVLLNAKLAYQINRQFSVAVFGRNLTDELNQQGALVSGDRVASRYGEPRSVGAMIEWQL